MRTLGKTIYVHRGETFVLARKVFKDDGVTPFVLSMYIKNPYIIITITSNTYDINGRYKYNAWLNLSTYPSFRSITPEYVENSVISSNQLPSGKNADGKDCVFYTQDEYGNKEFYYYTNGAYKPYRFVFHKHFLNVHTKDWTESQYRYSFRLVGGQDTHEYLLNAYKGVYPDRMHIPDDNKTLYDEIANCRPDLINNIRYSAPLVNFFTEDILQKPEKLVIMPSK